jgi:hypothetical protein
MEVHRFISGKDTSCPLEIKKNVADFDALKKREFSASDGD